MNKLESIKLFQSIQSVSDKYRDLDLGRDEEDIENNLKLQSLIELYKSRVDSIKERTNFLSKQTRDSLKDKDLKVIYSTLVDLNSFALQKYNSIISESINSVPLRAVLFSTVDELILINNSIRNKEYLKDKNTYFFIYEKVVINAFSVFLALKDMDMEEDKIKNLSQALLSQIQTLSIISM